MLSPETTPNPSPAEDAIVHKRPPAGPEAFAHRNLRHGEFWRAIPAYQDVDEATFLDHIWQGKNSITTPQKLIETIQGLAPQEFIEDAKAGFAKAPMSVRISPYMISCIDWSDPYKDPIRTQFLPLGSRIHPDHPMLTLDSLAEQDDAPVPGLTHRYPDKALFLALDVCPVYCRFCTRSYAVGTDTEEVEKVSLNASPKRWAKAFEYIRQRPELEDVVISGGDSYQLAPSHLKTIGETLLDIPHIRRMRFATKGPAVMPMKILTDEAWFEALVGVVQRGRTMGKEVVLHTHFNHPNEITWITERAMQRCFQAGIFVRNQSVLQRGVNDTAETMHLLVKRLGYMNVHPYYVYMHDLVRGVEDLRTSLQTALDIEKEIRGTTAGFNTPTFVCDAPGGGGKRDAHSYDHYDRENGISVFSAPRVKPGAYFVYFDPLHQLSPVAQARWKDPTIYQDMIQHAIEAAKAGRGH